MARRKRSKLRWFVLLILIAALGWVGFDLFGPRSSSLRQFDPGEVARLETAMWRSYYAKERLKLFNELAELMRTQYHMPLVRSNAVAYQAAQAAFVFKEGHHRADYERALPYLQRALRLQPDLAEASSLLGTAYVRLGQFAKAIPTLEKAAPSDHYGSVHYQLYEAYRKLGHPELARKELARSQDLRRRYLERDVALIMGSPQREPGPQ